MTMFYLSYFNTSHVTVYLIRLSTISLTSIFQYISCYCLSILVLFHSENEFISIHLMLLFIKQKHRTGRRKHGISIHLMLLFILSPMPLLQSPALHFNTSHVTVYLTGSSPKESIFLNFNTSHVTVYRIPYRHTERLFQISIHLMLLFIKLVVRIIGLSVHFNTSHVTVYRITVTQFKANLCISIHLMLLFIGLGLTFTDSSLNFNTSHVTVYLIVRDTALFKISISIHLMLLFIV